MRFHLEPELLTHVAEIDRQHQALLDAANHILATDDLMGMEEARLALRFLEAYATHHCDAEEQLMGLLEYDALDVHHLAHLQLHARVVRLQAHLTEQGSPVGARSELQRVMAEGFLRHIREHDVPLARWMARNRTGGHTVLAELDMWERLRRDETALGTLRSPAPRWAASPPGSARPGP